MMTPGHQPPPKPPHPNQKPADLAGAPIAFENVAAEQQSSGHPDGLYVLFFTEMWERFSYYGMRALLTLYMIQGLHFSQQRQTQWYGWYTGLVYLTPIFGGMLADRVLGYRKTILLGATLMMAGHFLMAIETIPYFVAAMGLLILGNGAFKPNISTLVGKLYKPGDPRRDAGFSIFYMGINVGAAASPLVCGTLGQRYGWKYGFGAAGVGMFIGMCTFLLGQHRLKAINLDLPEPATGFAEAKQDDKASHEERQTEAGRILALLIIAFFTIFFWAGFEQAGNTMALWAEFNTKRDFVLPIAGHFDMPSSWFQSVNAIFIIVLAPIMGLVWMFLGRRKREPGTPLKMVFGLLFLGLGFVVMALAAISAGSDKGSVSSMWLVFAYFLHTVGELCLSPIGLSLVTKLAPVRLGGMLMGVWFVAIFLGNKAAGMFGELWEQTSHVNFFSIFIGTSVAAGLMLFFLLKPLKKLIAGAA